MPLTCTAYGHTHWEEAPVQIDTLNLARERGTLTARELADERGIRIQAAAGRLRLAGEAGLIVPEQRAFAHRGGTETAWRPVAGAPAESPVIAAQRQAIRILTDAIYTHPDLRDSWIEDALTILSDSLSGRQAG